MKYYLIYEWNGRYNTCSLIKILTDKQEAIDFKRKKEETNTHQNQTYELREFNND